MPWHSGSLTADCFQRAHFYPCAKRRLKQATAEKEPSTVNIHLLPASTHVLTPRHCSHKQPLAAAGSSTGAPATPWGRSLADAVDPRLPVQGRLCSRLTAAVTSSRDAAAEHLAEKAVSPQRDKGTGSCWGQTGEPPAATAWGSRCPGTEDHCPGCGGRVSISCTPSILRAEGPQGGSAQL